MDIKESDLEELAFLEMEEIKTMLVNFLNNNCDFSYEVEARVKSLDKLKQKLALYSSMGVENPTLIDIPDIIGFRISLDNEAEVIKMINLINNFAEYHRTIDNFTYPKETGFKAFAFYYNCFGFNTEIQIMTKNMRNWTNKTHKEYDNKKYGNLSRTRMKSN